MNKNIKYESPKNMTLEEALGVDEEEIGKRKEELLQSLSIHDFVEAQRQDVKMLKSINLEVDASIAALERGRVSREETEGLYALKILLLLHMARSFHPLSAYGRMRLEEAIKCRQEFEALVEPLITNITADNADLFSSVLTPDLAEDVSVGRLYAIGALRRDDSAIYGVGAIVFHIEESIVYESGILRVMWLYVNPDYRQRGVAHHLIGEVLKLMVDRGIDHASADFPVKSEHSALMSYILGSWHFEMETGLNPEALFKVRDVFNYGKTRSYIKGAKKLASLDEKTYMQLVNNALRRFSYRGYLRHLISDGSYIDRELSCFTGNATDVSAILLAHRLPSGRCRVEYLSCAPGQELQMRALICSYMDGAAMSSKDEALIEIPVDMEEIGLFLDEVCPRQVGMYMVEGVLMPPAEETDMDKADVEQLLAASDL